MMKQTRCKTIGQGLIAIAILCSLVVLPGYSQSSGPTHVAALDPFDPEVAEVINKLLEDENIQVKKGVDKGTPNFLAEVNFEFERFRSFSPKAKQDKPKEEEKSKNVFSSIFNTLKKPFTGSVGYVYKIDSTFEFPDFREFEFPTIRSFDHNEALDMYCRMAAQGLLWTKNGKRSQILELKRGVTIQSMAELEKRMYGEVSIETVKEETSEYEGEKMTDKKLTVTPSGVEIEANKGEMKVKKGVIMTGKSFFVLMTDNTAWLINQEPGSKELKLYRLLDWLDDQDSTLVGPRVGKWIDDNGANIEAAYIYDDGTVDFDEDSRLEYTELLDELQ